MNDHPHKIYRSRDGKVLGVCAGIAKYFGLDVGVTRLVSLLLIFFTGIWPGLVLYFVAGWIMPLEPYSDSYARHSADDYRHTQKNKGPFAGQYEKFQRKQYGYAGYTSSYRSDDPDNARLASLLDRAENLASRIQNMENKVTKNDLSWEERLYKDQ